MTKDDEEIEERVARAVREDVAVVPYDPRWPALFEEERQRLLAWLPSELIGRIEHFGSTAVPGLAAKPVVDMLVEVASLDETKRRVVPILQSKGYDYFWRPTWGDDVPPWYAWFIRRNGEGIRTHHIHMVESHFEHWDRLRFRDYLVGNPAAAMEYQTLKMRLAAAYPNDRVAYTAGKTGFIARVMETAGRNTTMSIDDADRGDGGPAPLWPESERLDDYLACSQVIDWREPEVVVAARGVAGERGSDVERAKRLYEWVRDRIPHSCDAGHEVVTCRASEVLRRGTGLCFAKSHLLAALLRAVGIPAGFCYQRLRYDEGSSRMVLHGLCGVYLESVGRWIRVDPRGNKTGVDAQFRVDGEQLAFPTDPARGEVVWPTVFVRPLASVVACLTTSASVSEALARLPDTLDAEWPGAGFRGEQP